MNTNHFTKIETTCLIASALIVVSALAIIVAHLIVPITLQNVYVGKLTFIGAACFIVIFVAILLQIPLLTAIFMKKCARRFQLLSAFFASVSVCFASILISGYMTAIALSRPIEHDYFSWPGFALTLGLAIFLWRNSSNADMNAQAITYRS